jgi:protein subunit release factor B
MTRTIAGVAGGAIQIPADRGFPGPGNVREWRRVSSQVTREKIDDLARRMAGLGVEEADLVEKFVRGAGAGGQKINKTSSCVFLKHLPSGLCVKCQADRSRELNRFLARRELCDRLEQLRDGRIAAKVWEVEKIRRQKRRRSRRSRQRSVEDKRIQSGKKAMRRAPGPD